MRRLLALLLAVSLPLAGCGNRHLVVNVDVLSYMDPSLTDIPLGPLPAYPGGLYTGEQEIIKNIEVNLVDGTSSVSEVQSVAIAMMAIASDSTGAGSDTLRLYLCQLDEDPLSTDPAVTLPITLTPGQVDSVRIDLGTDSRVAELFSGKRMRLTLTTALRGPDSGEDLNARVKVASLTATVVASRKGGL
jgi:hypothetical protein